MKIVFPTIFTCQNNKNMFYTIANSLFVFAQP